MTENEAILDMVLSEIREIKVSVESLDYAIRGNGSPGLKERVSNIEDKLRQHKERDAWKHRAFAAAFLAGLPMLWDWAKHKLGW